MQSTLDLIEKLLRKYDNYGHAEHVAKCREKLNTKGVSAYLDFATLEWWGGSGSIADIFLHRPNQQPSEEQKEDNRMLRSALIDVYNSMKVNGVRMTRADHWADVFCKWRQQGI